MAAEEELLESKVDVSHRSKFPRFSELAVLADFQLLVDTATEDCFSCHIFFSIPRHPVLFLSVAAEKQYLEYKC